MAEQTDTPPQPPSDDPSTQDFRGPEQVDSGSDAPGSAPVDQETPMEPGDANAQPSGGANSNV